jgi:type IV secretory pathway VirB3-like protein
MSADGAPNQDKMAVVIDTLTKLAGLLALGGAVTTFLGGAAIWVRLQHARFPYEAVLYHLSHEFLIEVGLVDVIPYTLLIGGLFVLVGLLPGGNNRSIGDPAIANLFTATTRQRAVVGVTIVGGVLGLLFLPIDMNFIWKLVLAIATVGILLGVSAWIVGSYQKQLLRRWTAAILAGLSIAVLVGPWWVAFHEQRTSFPNALICTKSRSYFGVLVGQTSDTVYLGRKEGSQIALIPAADVEQIYVGGEGPCPPPSDVLSAQPSPSGSPQATPAPSNT